MHDISNIVQQMLVTQRTDFFTFLLWISLSHHLVSIAIAATRNINTIYHYYHRLHPPPPSLWFPFPLLIAFHLWCSETFSHHRHLNRLIWSLAFLSWRSKLETERMQFSHLNKNYYTVQLTSVIVSLAAFTTDKKKISTQCGRK